MSEPRTGRLKMERTGSWHRWQMAELPEPRTPREEPVAAPERPREETLAEQRSRVRREAYQAGYEAGQCDGAYLGWHSGHEEGFAHGQQQGQELAQQQMQEQIKQTLAPLAALAEKTSEAVQHLDDELAADLVDVALVVGGRLAGDALDARPEQVLEIIRELLHREISPNVRPRLWLHPRDLELVEQHLGNELEAAGWQLQPDDQLSRGGCRLSTREGEIDATREERWEAITRQVKKRARSRNRRSGASSQQGKDK
ncbi:MAG: flagellar assembly protein FliH [Pseudohongiellaceae bacterium]